MLEIPALLLQGPKQSGKLSLCKPLQYSRLGDPLAWAELCSVCIPSCVPPPAQVLLQGSPGWTGNEKIYYSISSVVLWLFLHLACASSHKKQNQ